MKMNDTEKLKHLTDTFEKTLMWLSVKYPVIYEEWTTHLRPPITERNGDEREIVMIDKKGINAPLKED